MAPPPPAPSEMSIGKARRSPNFDRFVAPIAAEMAKQLDTYHSIRPILPENIAKDAVRIRGSMQFEDKFTSDGSYDRSTARLAAAGDT